MRFQFGLVGAMLIGALSIGSAAQRNDRGDEVRQIAASVGSVLGTASACREIPAQRIKAMTDKLFSLIKVYAFGDEETAAIQRVYNQRYLEGQRTLTGKQTDCAAANRDLTALERIVTSPQMTAPAAAVPAPPPGCRSSFASGGPERCSIIDRGNQHRCHPGDHRQGDSIWHLRAVLRIGQGTWPPDEDGH